MSLGNDRAHLLDIREAAVSVQKFVRELPLDEFLANDEKQSAVLLKLIVMGEATKGLSMGFRGRHPEVPWSGIAGMRDRLVHGYRQWDLEEVWRVATTEIPPMVTQFDALLRSSDPPPE